VHFLEIFHINRRKKIVSHFKIPSVQVFGAPSTSTAATQKSKKSQSVTSPLTSVIVENASQVSSAVSSSSASATTSIGIKHNAAAMTHKKPAFNTNEETKGILNAMYSGANNNNNSNGGERKRMLSVYEQARDWRDSYSVAVSFDNLNFSSSDYAKEDKPEQKAFPRRGKQISDGREALEKLIGNVPQLNPETRAVRPNRTHNYWAFVFVFYNTQDCDDVIKRC